MSRGFGDSAVLGNPALGPTLDVFDDLVDKKPERRALRVGAETNTCSPSRAELISSGASHSQDTPPIWCLALHTGRESLRSLPMCVWCATR